MNTLYIVASCLFFLWVIRNIFFWVALWQVKEYRLDRLLVHLKETGQGRNLLFSPLSIIKTVGIFAYLLTINNPGILAIYHFFVTVIFFLLAVSVVHEILLQNIRRPVLTVKAMLILSVAGVMITVLYVVPLVNRFLWLLIIDRAAVLIVSSIVFAFSFPTELIHDFVINRAVRMIRNHKKLLVIGVTGSYGKSSTKDYIAQILEKKFVVLKTKGTTNTPIGIARTVLQGLRANTEVFVVEMGAYKRGEIAQMCQIVNPKIGVITGINDQHLSLFGSLENTIKAKYELAEALPKNGFILFNGGNIHTRALYSDADREKMIYKIAKKDDVPDSTAVVVQNVSVRRESVSFSVCIGKKDFAFTSPLLGSHNIENVLPGIIIAKRLGMKNREIQHAVAALTPLPQTMTRYITKEGLVIIDDTFNANPQAVQAVLQYMKIYKGKRILVLKPMIELGQHARQDHYNLARDISVVCDYLFLTNKNYYSDIERGVKKANDKCKVVIVDSNAKRRISKLVGRGDIVVFEGKGREISILLKMFL